MASWSGVGRYTVGLARALAERADIELVQVCAAGDDAPAQPGFLVRALYASAHPFSVRGAIELARLTREAQPEVIHCLHFPTPAPLQFPLVVTLHDLIPLVVPTAMPATAKRIAYRLWNARAAAVADGVIAPSRATAEDVSRIFPAAADKLTMIPHAADDFAAIPPTVLQGAPAGLTSGPYLLAIGNTRPHKDLPTLFEAFSVVAPSFPETRLLLAGTEPAGYLDSQLAGVPPQVRSRVAFTGHLDDGALRTLYAGASAFVCPSGYEGFGFPLLEAMASGAPTVCADAASLPEVAGDAALMFPAGEHGLLATAITRVLRDPVLRKELSAKGRKRASRFSWAKTAAATAAIYSAVLEGRDASASGWDGEGVPDPEGNKP